MDTYKIYKDALEAYEHHTRGETPMPQDMKGAQATVWNEVKEYLFPVKKVIELKEEIEVASKVEAKKVKKGK